MPKITSHLKDETVTLPAYIVDEKSEGWTRALMPFDGVIISLNPKERNWSGIAIPLEVLDLIVKQLKERKTKNESNNSR